ncbi:DUF2071 domain-containing protein [Streptomyces sp. NPDC002144]|uniref:DUF2071 domain-containing protein n=1 Tax=Streptomyces sp. NPDC006668 TaxID=3156903 RepID=UPI003408FD68
MFSRGKATSGEPIWSGMIALAKPAKVWRAYTRRLGALWDTPVAHEPWPLREATLFELDETVTRAAGLPAPRTEPLVHFSDGVRQVRMGVSRPVRTGTDPIGVIE